jgi:hypothetical protein
MVVGSVLLWLNEALLAARATQRVEDAGRSRLVGQDVSLVQEPDSEQPAPKVGPSRTGDSQHSGIVTSSGTGEPTEMEDVERTRQGLSFDSYELNVHHSIWWKPLETVNRKFRQIVAS